MCLVQIQKTVVPQYEVIFACCLPVRLPVAVSYRPPIGRATEFIQSEQSQAATRLYHITFNDISVDNTHLVDCIVRVQDTKSQTPPFLINKCAYVFSYIFGFLYSGSVWLSRVLFDFIMFVCFRCLFWLYSVFYSQLKGVSVGKIRIFKSFGSDG